MNAIIKKTDYVKGIVEISGSKNATLPIVAASILSKGKVILKNVPDISDVNDLIYILKKINISVYKYENMLIIERNRKVDCKLLVDEVKKIRGSIYLWPVLLILRKKVTSHFPGGCNFGKRPIDYHLMAFEKMGVKIKEGKTIDLKVKKIKNAIISFPKKTVGGTINAIILSLFTKKVTIINNPSLDYEVLDTISFLNASGANITVNKDSIMVKGVKRLIGTTFKIMSDRIEAASYLFLATSLRNSCLTVTNINYHYLRKELKILEDLGVEIKKDNYKITICVKKDYKKEALQITTSDYPALSTDLQQIITPLLFNLTKESEVIDTIYKDRSKHINELKKLNGKIEIINNEKDLQVRVYPSNLKASIINGVDLRGTFGLIIAAGMAEGETKIIGIDNVLRGYEKIIEKLKKIKFNIEIEK